MAGRPVPSNYRCSICKKTGHARNTCPDAATLGQTGGGGGGGGGGRVDERHKFPSGIPKTNLRPAQPGDKFAMLGPDGYVVSDIEQKAAQIVKKDKPSFMDEDDDEIGGPSERAAVAAQRAAAAEQQLREQQQAAAAANADVSGGGKCPAELRCPYGDHLIKDAVLVPCCGHFVCCDVCIRERISNDEPVECPHAGCDQEIGSLISITPYHEMRKKVNEYVNEQKLAASTQRAALTLAQEAASLSKIAQQQTHQPSGDVFFDLILSGVGEEASMPLAKPIVATTTTTTAVVVQQQQQQPVSDGEVETEEDKQQQQQQQQQRQIKSPAATAASPALEQEEAKSALSPFPDTSVSHSAATAMTTETSTSIVKQEQQMPAALLPAPVNLAPIMPYGQQQQQQHMISSASSSSMASRQPFYPIDVKQQQQQQPFTSSGNLLPNQVRNASNLINPLAVSSTNPVANRLVINKSSFTQINTTLQSCNYWPLMSITP